MKAILFGYSSYAKEMAAQVKKYYKEVFVYTNNSKEKQSASEDGFNSFLFDIDDNYDKLLDEYKEDMDLFCALQDDAQNVFLTISLREKYNDKRLVALASTSENADKLKLAGANKVIASLETTANLFNEILSKPILNSVFHAILYEASPLKMSQIKVESASTIIGKKLENISEHTKHRVIILSISDNMKSSFYFTQIAHTHKFKEGDVLVVIGYDQNIENFQEEIRGK
ncbi:MAG: hypothetical protein GQ570_09510 [Helicobacteraceae bacterium]|nr:hypothetical protein [Helicobacteraceae bacterium]